MARTLESHLTTRVTKRVEEELGEVARAKGITPRALARTLIEEGLRRERHPGIIFRDGPAGRRAAIEGRRLDVWQVMDTVWASDGDIEPAASYLGLRPDQVRSAVSYYADYPDEIDEWSRRNLEEAERLQAAHEREQAALSR